MILTITDVHEEFTKNGDEYKKVSGVDGNGKETTKAVFNNLKEKWDLLQENVTLEFKMEKKGQFWNVVDILPVETPPPTEPSQADTSNMPEVSKVSSGKNRAFALSYSKDIACAKIAVGKDETYDKTIVRAVAFEAYLEHGDIPKEAKK